MIIPYDCPHCGEKIRSELTQLNQQTACRKCGAHSTIPFQWIRPGIVIGNGYRITKKLDESGKSKLFLAYQEAMDRNVVLKILPPEIADTDEEFQRFQREIKLAASINHPNILAAFGAGEDCGIYFLIRQHKPGETLEELSQKKGALPEKDILRKLLPIAKALRYAWDEHKVIHRNIKPEAVLFGDDGNSMLVDLGIAKSMESSKMEITRVGFTVGTPEYMSPEQVRGDKDIDCRSDIYSFCIVLYRALTGEVPFEDPSAMVVMQKQLNDPPIPAQFKNNGISTQCSTMIDKGLAKDPDRRFQTWQELIDTMNAILKGQSKPPKKEKRSAPKRKKRQPQGGINRAEVERIANQMYGSKYRKNRFLLYLMATLIPVLLVGIPMYMSQRSKEKQQQVSNLIQTANDYIEQKQFDEAEDVLYKARDISKFGSNQYNDIKLLIKDIRSQRRKSKKKRKKSR